MKRILLLAIIGMACSFAFAAHAQTSSNTIVRFRVMANARTVGDIDVELFDNDKPATVRNFLDYVLRGNYENTMFRVLFPSNALQGGSFRVQNPRDSGRFSTYIRTPSFAPVINEYDVGPQISNTFGTIAMIRASETNLDSATHTWIFNLADNSASLDPDKYTVFGRVIGGSNILSGFNELKYTNGIVNLGSFPFYGLTGLQLFNALPVAYQGWREPRTKELYTAKIFLTNSTDMTPPTVRITSPAANARFTNGPVVVTGTAADNVGVHWVWHSANNTIQTSAMGTNPWSATISSPVAGKNTIFVESVDTSGNRSLPAVRTFYYHPFIAQKGTYNGLFYENSQARQESSGTFTATLMESGAFTAALMAAGKRYSLRGQFVLEDQDGTTYGRASFTVPRAGAASLQVELAVNLSNPDDLITGLISAPGWEAPLSADRAVYSAANACPYEGRYTLILPGTPGDTNLPAGSGFGTVVIGKTGKLRLAGTLADGTKVSQSATVSGFGEWPVYVPLYRNQGSLVRWITFLEGDQDDFFGSLTWIKPVQPTTAKYYQAGFTNDIDATGSKYQRPTNSTDYVVNFTDGMVTFSDGNLAAPFSNSVMLTPGNKIVDRSITNKLKMTITTSSGLFRGSVTPPGATRSVSFQGAIHRKGNYGAGLLLSTNQSSSVLFAAP